MAVKGIDEQMVAYFNQLSLPEKKSVVQMLKAFVKGKDGEKENLEEYNKDIDEAMAEVARGEFYTHEEVLNMTKNW